MNMDLMTKYIGMGSLQAECDPWAEINYCSAKDRIPPHNRCTSYPSSHPHPPPQMWCDGYVKLASLAARPEKSWPQLRTHSQGKDVPLHMC